MTQVELVDVEESGEIGEVDSLFSAPEGCVLVGRSHQGNETGHTTYFYAWPVVEVEGERRSVQVRDAQWSEKLSESSGTRYTAPEGCVLVGREHNGDENGPTRYQYARLEFEGRACRVTPDAWATREPWQSLKESGHRFMGSSNSALIGRWHEGDENGPTEYRSGTISV